ncbi:MAG: hypothetical protein IH935_07280 [Acidobacteria bacterium]|nr:hypothetical protein [Acidobacteriota bacterium]
MELNEETQQNVPEPSLKERLIALRDWVAKETEITKRMRAEYADVRGSLPSTSVRDALAVLEARVAKLERSGRA